MVLVCHRRRILRIAAFIGVACTIFLCFQVFLVRFLDHDAHVGLRRGARPKFGLDDDELKAVDGGRRKTTQYSPQLQQKHKRECSSQNCNIVTDSTLPAISRRNVIFSSTTRLRSQSFLHASHVELSQFKSVWELLEHTFARPVILQKNLSEAHSTRGVHSKWQHLYEADDHVEYTCILSQVYL